VERYAVLRAGREEEGVRMTGYAIERQMGTKCTGVMIEVDGKVVLL
jgi:hypothetical protein